MKFAGVEFMEVFNMIISALDKIKKNIAAQIAPLWGLRVGFSQKDEHL